MLLSFVYFINSCASIVSWRGWNVSHAYDLPLRNHYTSQQITESENESKKQAYEAFESRKYLTSGHVARKVIASLLVHKLVTADWEWFHAVRTRKKKHVAHWQLGGQIGKGSQTACFALNYIQAVLDQVYIAGTVCMQLAGPLPCLMIWAWPNKFQAALTT